MRLAPVALPPRTLVVPIARGWIAGGEIPSVRLQLYATVLHTPPFSPGTWLGAACDAASRFLAARSRA